MSSTKRETKKRVMKKNVETDSEMKGNTKEKAILNLGNKLHDFMREEQVIGSKAMHDTMRLLCLRFIQPLIKPNGKLYTLVDKNSYMKDGEFIEGVEEGFLEYLHLDKLLLQADSDKSFDTMLRIIWKRLLSRHELTKDIFKNSDFFIMENIQRIRKCFEVIESTLRDISFDTLNYDVKGSMYEYFINDYAGKGGKEFGQFFTPRSMIKLIRTLSKRYFPDEVKSIYDPCMGTAGFLTEMYKEYKSTLVDENVSGGELEPDTYTFALMNIILTTGSKCNIKRHDSLHNNENVKYDLIGTNPPFGMKGIKYDDVISKCEFKDGIDPKKLYPIKTNDGSALFLQHCIGKLSDGGVCNIVLPDGQLLSGKTFIKLRKHLLTTCNLVAVLCAPSGAFTNAGVKTAVLIFSRKVVEEKPIPTDKVDFYSCDKECKEYTLTGTVCMEQFEKSNYSLDYNMYVIREEKKFTKEKCEMKTLGEICEIKNGKNIKKDDLKEGIYPVVGGGKSPLGFHNEYNVDENTIIISKDGSYAGYVSRYNDKVFVSNHGLYITNINDKIVIRDYIYYYLLTIQDSIYSLQTGTAQPGIHRDNVSELQIPVPSLEIQQQIILDCELYEKKKNNLKEYISILKQEAECLHRLMIKPLFKNEGEMKMLGEVCEIKNGKNIKKDDLKEGIYPVVGGGKSPLGFHNEYNVDENTIIISKDGSYAGYVSRYNAKVFVSNHGLYITNINDKIVIRDYIYYYLLTIQDSIYSLQTGTAQPGIHRDNVSELQIPVPSLEIQQQIISQYEEKMKSIDEIKNKILNVENIILECNAQQKLLFYI
jgi:type I restriction-modification system DNA methylase subunit/restriction endonuclease S subunit